MSPILFQIGDFIIYSYPLFMGLAWGVAFHLCRWVLSERNISSKGFNGLFWGIFVTSWVGAKLFFLLFSAFDKFSKYGSSSNFWLGGGFVFFGGLIIGGIYALLYCLVLKKFDLKNLIYFLPALSAGHAIGRIGCFLAGCCFGTQCHLPWSVHLHGLDRHPVQLYESFSLLILTGVLVRLVKKECGPWVLANTYFMSYALIRFVLEFFRGDKIRGEFAHLSSSQHVALAILMIMLVLNVWRYRKT